jgi:hypothetical protein
MYCMSGLFLVFSFIWKNTWRRMLAYIRDFLWLSLHLRHLALMSGQIYYFSAEGRIKKFMIWYCRTLISAPEKRMERKYIPWWWSIFLQFYGAGFGSKLIKKKGIAGLKFTKSPPHRSSLTEIPGENRI